MSLCLICNSFVVDLQWGKNFKRKTVSGDKNGVVCSGGESVWGWSLEIWLVSLPFVVVPCVCNCTKWSSSVALCAAWCSTVPKRTALLIAAPATAMIPTLRLLGGSISVYASDRNAQHPQQTTQIGFRPIDQPSLGAPWRPSCLHVQVSSQANTRLHTHGAHPPPPSYLHGIGLVVVCALVATASTTHHAGRAHTPCKALLTSHTTLHATLLMYVCMFNIYHPT